MTQYFSCLILIARLDASVQLAPMVLVVDLTLSFSNFNFQVNLQTHWSPESRLSCMGVQYQLAYETVIAATERYRYSFALAVVKLYQVLQRTCIASCLQAMILSWRVGVRNIQFERFQLPQI